MTYYSQFGQDRELERLIDVKVKGFFIEAGAYDGITESNTKRLEDLGWDGLCIEPIDIFYEKCKNNRKCLTVNTVLYDKNDEEIIFIDGTNVERPCHSGIADNLSSSLKLVEGKSIGVSVKKKTQTIEKVLSDHFENLNTIDFLSLDTEGSEYIILKVFPFDKYQFKIVCIEHNFNVENRRSIYDLFHSKGYQLHIPLNLKHKYDDWYVSSDVAKYSICLGIGDILLLAGWFKYKNYNGILLVSKHIIQFYRNGSEMYLNFILKLINAFLPNFRIELIEKEDQVISVNNFLEIEQCKYSDLSLRNFLPVKKNNTILEDEYVVLFTKYRIDGKNDLDKFKGYIPELVEIIKLINYKIVLVGEREIEENFETKYHDVSSLYNSLKDHVYLDLTEQTLTNNPNWDVFNRDIEIVKNAKCVIGFGVGGNLCISIAFAKRLIFFTGIDCYKVLKDLNQDKESENILTFDLNIFRKAVNEL